MTKKLSSKQLRNIILETVEEIRKEKLVTERKQELRKVIKKARLVLEDAVPGDVDPKRFPIKLSDAAASAGPEAELRATGGDDDGVQEEDIVDAQAGSVAVKELKPSQSSMNIEKAVAFAIAAIRGVKPFTGGPGGDLGAIITSDNHIMDGHHRWIATGMVDPSAEVGGFIVDFPARQMIAALNMITVKLGITKGKPGSGGFEQFNEAGIKAVLDKYVREGIWSADGEPATVVEACEKFVDGEKGAAAVAAAAKKMADNVAQLTMSVPDGFPERPDMPVISKGKGHLDLAIDLLKSGQVDLNEPYAEPAAGSSTAAGVTEADEDETVEADETDEMNESTGKNDSLIMERWNKLAGLLK